MQMESLSDVLADTRGGVVLLFEDVKCEITWLSIAGNF